MQVLSSVSKALSLLDAFTGERPELSLAELAKHLDSHKSSAFRLLATLESQGFVEKNPSSRKYRLGWKLFDLANRLLARYELRDLASPFMEELAQKTKEIVHLSILSGAEIVYLEKKGRSQPLTVATMVGGHSPAHASAMGKALLAGLTEPELEGILRGRKLQRFTPTTITDPGKLRRELATSRRQGYSLDNEETFPGIRCVAAPLLDRDGRVVAAISVTVPKQRMTNERRSEVRKLVMDTARRISERIRLSGIDK